MGEANTAKKRSFFKSLRSEFKKIIWPDGKTLWKKTVTVIAVSLVIGAIIALIDLLLQTGFSFIF